jgi:hypothetical protein
MSYQPPAAGHRYPDYMRKMVCGKELTHNDLKITERNLLLLLKYFESGKECHATVEKCVEVVRGLRDLWTRNAVQRNRMKKRKGSND